MPSVELPYASVEELADQFNRLADQVLFTDSTSTDGQNARRLYRVAVRALELKAMITGDPLISNLIFDVSERLKDK
jgi:hypothetical protein